MPLFGKGENKFNLGDKLNGFGKKLTNGLNKHLSNIKLPTVNTDNEIKISKEVYIFGAVVIVVVMLWTPIKRILGIR